MNKKTILVDEESLSDLVAAATILCMLRPSIQQVMDKDIYVDAYLEDEQKATPQSEFPLDWAERAIKGVNSPSRDAMQ